MFQDQGGALRVGNTGLGFHRGGGKGKGEGEGGGEILPRMASWFSRGEVGGPGMRFLAPLDPNRVLRSPPPFPQGLCLFEVVQTCSSQDVLDCVIRALSRLFMCFGPAFLWCCYARGGWCRRQGPEDPQGQGGPI